MSGKLQEKDKESIDAISIHRRNIMQKKYRISGKSMLPFLKDGAIIETEIVTSLRLGDIVIFTMPDGKKIFHRVVQLKDGEVLCKGDNCLHFDRVQYDFGDQYIVLRHKMQEQIAKVSYFFGKEINIRYERNPERFHKNFMFHHLIRVFYSLIMNMLYFVYVVGVGRRSDV